ncbi:MAG: hypothetical protein M5R40_26605 [Anaerolineae bacterium]|nr:hypothetical protein [Anaerolineae bacterium]
MTANNLPEKAATYLQKLCRDIPSRRVGSAGNRAATDFFAGVVASFGFEVETSAFDCVDWRQAGVDLRVGDRPFQAFPSPYSLGCDVRAPLVVVATVAELEAAEIADRVVLLRGGIAAHQVMPKNFPFYNPEEHQHIIRLLETGRPRAIIAATTRDVDTVGSLYRFPSSRTAISTSPRST